MVSLLKRYTDGEHLSVWNEVRRRTNDDAWAAQDVVDVVSATMERVAQNADIISRKLNKLGWKVLPLGDTHLRTMPTIADKTVMNRMEHIIGDRLPLSIAKFWSVVGGINWVWDYTLSTNCPEIGNDIYLDEMDPFCVPSPTAISYQLDDWESGEYFLMTDGDDQYRLDLAPDYLHKVNASGGDAHSICLPSVFPDPDYEFDDSRLPFVDYLRMCFQWGGFPKLKQVSNQSDVKEVVRELTHELLTF